MLRTTHLDFVAVMAEIAHERPLGPVGLALEGLGLEPRDAQKLATALEAQGHSTPEGAQVRSKIRKPHM